MKSVVIGLVAALVLAVLGIVALENINDRAWALTVQWLLGAFVPLALLALFSVIVAWASNVGRPRLRRAIRALLLTVYVAVGTGGYLSAGAQYAQEVADYEQHGCRSAYTDVCGPSDARLGWVIAWTVIGLAGLVATCLRAKRMREDDYWYGDVADQRFA